MDIWSEVCLKLRKQMSDHDYSAWIAPIRFDRFEAGYARLIVPSMFTKNWIATHFLAQITEIWAGIDSTLISIDLVTASDKAAQKASKAPKKEAKDKAPTSKEKSQKDRKKHYQTISQKLDPKMTFASFVVGKPNEFACAAAGRITKAIETDSIAFNPLFLYGGVGLGKSHLMHAICWKVLEKQPQKTVLYLSAEKFMHSFIQAIRSNDQVRFKDLFRSVDILLVDDIQFIAGKESTQEEFFHTFNALVDQGRQVVLSADRSPSEIQGIDHRLISRMNSGMVANIHATTFELRLSILQDKNQRYNYLVNDAVLHFIASKLTSNIRELEGALARIHFHQDLTGREALVDDANDILHDLVRSNNRVLEVSQIQKKVADHYNIKLSDMRSSRRMQSIARPRQIAMYLSKQLTDLSLPEIGRNFGGKDHTTVMYAVRKIEELLETNGSLQEDIRILTQILENQ